MNEVKAANVESALSVRIASQGAWRQETKEITAQTAAAEPSEKDVRSAVEALNEFARQNEVNLTFSVDKSTGRTIIKVIDAETEEVVRQMPPEAVLECTATLDEMAGHLLSAKA